MPTPPSDSLAVPALDPVASARWRARALETSPWLHEEVAARMLDRLDWMRQVPSDWVHWEAVHGGLTAHARLRERYPQARVWLGGLDPEATGRRLRDEQRQALPVWRRAVARWTEPASLPVPEGARGVADLVWANMALHIHPRPAELLALWRDWLRVGGFAMWSGLGPDTLIELRQLHAAQGWPPPAHPFTDMHDWGDMMVEAGFAEPVVDMERLTLTYPSAERLLLDLRAWGRNLHAQRPGSCRGRGYRRAWLEAVEQGLPRDAEGRLQLTVEVVYGHAFKPEPKVRVASSSEVSLDDMRALLKRPKPER